MGGRTISPFSLVCCAECSVVCNIFYRGKYGKESVILSDIKKPSTAILEQGECMCMRKWVIILEQRVCMWAQCVCQRVCTA